jgi:hypothetical protein
MLFSMLLDANRLWVDELIGLMACAHHRCTMRLDRLWLAHEGTPPTQKQSASRYRFARHSRSSLHMLTRSCWFCLRGVCV